MPDPGSQTRSTTIHHEEQLTSKLRLDRAQTFYLSIARHWNWEKWKWTWGSPDRNEVDKKRTVIG
jgi:hypothetical protein